VSAAKIKSPENKKFYLHPSPEPQNRSGLEENWAIE
jgi:hypothetical protein